MKLSEIKANPSNPRVLRDDKFQKLVKSLTDFPEMMYKRPIVVDDTMTVLGGNMRLRALQHLFGKSGEIPDEWVTVAEGWTEEQKREFIIKDNAAFGEWDWDALANEWNADDLTDWGIDVPLENFANPDDFGTDFQLKSGEKSKFETMTFVVSEDQRELIQEAIGLALYCEAYTNEDNENQNGAALAVIVSEWLRTQKEEETVEELRQRVEELRQYLRDALANSGHKAADVNDLLGTQMAGHYFGESQWTFPTRIAYEAMRTIMDLPRDYYECKKIEKQYLRAVKLQEINGTL